MLKANSTLATTSLNPERNLYDIHVIQLIQLIQ